MKLSEAESLVNIVYKIMMIVVAIAGVIGLKLFWPL